MSVKEKKKEDSQPRSRWVSMLRGIGYFFGCFIIALVVVSLVRVFLVQQYMVPSSSMEQTVLPGDKIAAWKPGEVERGDVVVFRDDLSWLRPIPETSAWLQFLAWIKFAAPTDEQYLVKRVIGMPGDTVKCCESGRITVNGYTLDEPYVFLSYPDQDHDPFEIVVPEGRFFAMGDHRDDSWDSSMVLCATSSVERAPPSFDSIQGPVFAVVLPLSRIGGIPTQEVFSNVPPPSGPPPSVDDARWNCPKG